MCKSMHTHGKNFICKYLLGLKVGVLQVDVCIRGFKDVCCAVCIHTHGRIHSLHAGATWVPRSGRFGVLQTSVYVICPVVYTCMDIIFTCRCWMCLSQWQSWCLAHVYMFTGVYILYSCIHGKYMYTDVCTYCTVVYIHMDVYMYMYI